MELDLRDYTNLSSLHLKETDIQSADKTGFSLYGTEMGTRNETYEK